MPQYLTPREDGVVCRACGAANAPPCDHDNEGLELGVCEHCWRSFKRSGYDADETIEEGFNRWLARKLFLDLRHMERTGVTGRCEAVSNWLEYRPGYQCAAKASVRRRDGRLVCWKHFGATDPGFVDTADHNQPYEMFRAMVSRLIKKDHKLLDTLAEAMGLEGSMLKRLKHPGGPGATPIDISGRRFGKLVALRLAGIDNAKGHHRTWWCRCDCGQERELRSDHLLYGYHLSCGCERDEKSSARAQSMQRDERGHFLPPPQLPTLNLG